MHFAERRDRADSPENSLEEVQFGAAAGSIAAGPVVGDSATSEDRRDARVFWERQLDTGAGRTLCLPRIEEVAALESSRGSHPTASRGIWSMLYELSLSPQGREYLPSVLPELLELPPGTLNQIELNLRRADGAVLLGGDAGLHGSRELVGRLSHSGFLHWFATCLGASGPADSGADPGVSELARTLQDQARLPALKLLTYNIWGMPWIAGGKDPSRYPEIARELARSDFGVVAIQEMWSKHTACIVPDSGFQFTAHTQNMHGLLGGNGLVTLSRYPIVQQEMLEFSHVAGLERFVRKGALFTRLQVRDSQVIDVYNLHLNSSGEGIGAWVSTRAAAARARESQLEEVYAWISERRLPGVPVFVMGDFNVHETEPDYHHMRARFGSDLYREVFPEGVPLQAIPQSLRDDFVGYTFDSEKNSWARSKHEGSSRFDYIFLVDPPEKELAVHAAREFTKPGSKGKHLSDHYGVSSNIFQLGA